MADIRNLRGDLVGRVNTHGSTTRLTDSKGNLVARESSGFVFDNKGNRLAPEGQLLRQLLSK